LIKEHPEWTEGRRCAITKLIFLMSKAYMHKRKRPLSPFEQAFYWNEVFKCFSEKNRKDYYDDDGFCNIEGGWKKAKFPKPEFIKPDSSKPESLIPVSPRPESPNQSLPNQSP
jgi:hypothetical protein